MVDIGPSDFFKMFVEILCRKLYAVLIRGLISADHVKEVISFDLEILFDVI